MPSSSKNFPFVSVVVPVFNDSERIRVCLGALEKQTYAKKLYEVIVVDNASDESVKPILDKFTRARAAFEPRRGSYAARNKGISLSNGEVIAFTDSDCVPASDWIEKGVENLLRFPNCGIVGGKVEFTFKNQDKPMTVEVVDSISFLQQKLYVEVYKFSATANLFTFREVLEHVGHFDWALKSGGDWEWSRRVFLSGYHIIYADDTKVSHRARKSFGELYNKAIRVARGLHKLEKKDSYPSSTSFSSLLIELLPPKGRILCLLSDTRLKKPTQKILAVFVMLLLHYIIVLERKR